MAEEPEAERAPAGAASDRKRRPSRTARASQYWLLVLSPENYRRTREHGFATQGIKARHRRRVETMRPGDRVLYYVNGRMAFPAAATVISPMFESHELVWRNARRDEDYPWRVRVRPDTVLEDADWVRAPEIAYRLEYVRKWPPESWSLAFQGHHLHLIPQKDFKLVEDELKRAQRARSLAG